MLVPVDYASASARLEMIAGAARIPMPATVPLRTVRRFIDVKNLSTTFVSHYVPKTYDLCFS